MDVWILNWYAKMKGPLISLRAKEKGMEIDLQLLPKRPPVIHGRDGISRKGPREGQASYYYSFTEIYTRGKIGIKQEGSLIEASGRSWFDHEFGSNQLSPDQVGWDWFSLHLSDGRDLMIYLIRRKDGSIEPASSGTLVERDGSPRHLGLSAISVSVLDRWRSPKSGGIYPSRWKIGIPAYSIELVISPLVADQELDTRGSTGVIYWEGAVTGKGISGGEEVLCEGYVELTGYAGAMGGLF